MPPFVVPSPDAASPEAIATAVSDYITANPVMVGIEEVTGLSAALDGKAPSTHTHAISDVTDLSSRIFPAELHVTDTTTEPTATDGEFWVGPSA